MSRDINDDLPVGGVDGDRYELIDTQTAALTAAGYKITAREPVDDEGEGTWWRAMRDAAT